MKLGHGPMMSNAGGGQWSKGLCCLTDSTFSLPRRY